jgi:hypothetical protein
MTSRVRASISRRRLCAALLAGAASLTAAPRPTATKVLAINPGETLKF